MRTFLSAAPVGFAGMRPFCRVGILRTDRSDRSAALSLRICAVKILLIPDSFKGSLSSSRLCAILKKEALAVFPDAEVKAFLMADGGEGTIDAIHAAAGGSFVVLDVVGTCGQPVRARYLSLGETAYVELAEAAGLQHRQPGFDAANTTTFGAGQLMRHAIDAGHRRIVLTLGGSATNDAGCGMAAALGTRFIAPNGRPFIPTGATLQAVRSIQLNPFFFVKNGIRIEALCDVTNPFSGPQGAAYVFGPQKGASPETVKVLDAGLRHIAGIFEKGKGPRLNAMPGAGAAGGCGGGVAAFLNGRLVSGTETLLDVMRFAEHAEDADLIITGEGLVDGQSAGGKVISGVAARAGGKPVIVLTGGIAADLAPLYDMGVTAVFPVTPMPQTVSEAMAGAAKNTAQAAQNLFRFAAALRR